jgi:uncharacterized membrane protein YphA (DoxX/SURF4 family)
VSRGHSRITGAVRLLIATWLLVAGFRTLADPGRADNRLPLDVVLSVAALEFALGVFLLTGFMTRLAGLILVGLGVWEAASFGLAAWPVALSVVGLYLMLRGGGAWAMDIYVQKMQDRVRKRESSKPPSRA